MVTLVIVLLVLVCVVLLITIIVLNDKLKKTTNTIHKEREFAAVSERKYKAVKTAISDTFAEYRGKNIYIAGMKKIIAATKDL